MGPLLAIAVCANILVRYGRRVEALCLYFCASTAIVSTAFFLIADIDSLREGLIHVRPQNIESLAQSFTRKAEISRKGNWDCP
jgi:hypothetical protein